MPRGVLTTTCAAALAAMAVVTPSAIAAPGIVTDPDFAGATSEGTEVTTGIGPAQARRARGVRGRRAAGRHDGDAVGAARRRRDRVSAGSLIVDGARSSTIRPRQPAGARVPRGVRRATPFQHVGFGDRHSTTRPWAMFSTGGGALPIGLYARTAVGRGRRRSTRRCGRRPACGARLQDRVDRRPRCATPSTARPARRTPRRSRRRCARSSAISTQRRRRRASSSRAWSATACPPSGTLISRVFDSGDSRAAWGTLTATGGAAGVVFATRSGNTATPDASWSDWANTGAAGAIASPAGRYMQYRATLSTERSVVSPTARRRRDRLRRPGAARRDRRRRRLGHDRQRAVLEPGRGRHAVGVQPRRRRVRRVHQPEGVRRPRRRRTQVAVRAVDKNGTGAAASPAFTIAPLRPPAVAPAVAVAEGRPRRPPAAARPSRRRST